MTGTHDMTPSLRLAHVDGMLDHCREHGTPSAVATLESVRNHLAAVVNEHNALLAEREPLRPEYGIRIDYVSTLREERAIAETLGDALAELEEFDAQHYDNVVSRTLIQRKVGDWHEIGDGRG